MSTLGNAIGASASALTAERVRIEVAVSNLANAESTRGPNGQPYRRRDVVLQSEPGPFSNALDAASPAHVRVAAIVEDQSPFQPKYNPGHPDADAQGWVQMPNVDPAEEMVDMLSASRAYQANLTAVNLIRDMVQKSLELGR
jgi:flagellar basal-body rod protein FlgC